MRDKATFQTLLQQYEQGQISRRKFMERALSAGLATAAIASLPASARAATPQKGGKLTVAVETAQNVDSLDPTKYFSTADILRGFALYDLLVNRGTDLKPIPYLAESWDSDPTASEWVFKLRKGVEFHDGKAFTADDVIFSLSRHTDPKSSSPAKAYLSQIKEIKKEDDHTVRFVLNQPNADWPIILSNSRTHITQNGYTDFSKTTVGTGPYKVKEFKPGSTYVFERNDHYWGSGGPYIDEIEYVSIGDPTARVNALLAGDIQLLALLDPKLAALVSANPDTDVIRAKGNGYLNVALMVDRAPTKDNNLRLALKYALDREKIVANVLKGYGLVGNDFPVASIDPYYNQNIPQRPYDPDKANFYIRKAGLENQPLDFYASDVPGAGGVAAAQVFQQSAAAAKIKLNIIQPPPDTYWQDVWIKKPISVSGWDGRPVPDLIFSIAYKGGGSYNETAWNNPQFDKLLVEARGVLDPVKRKEIYGELESQLQDEGGVIILAFTDVVDARSKRVQGITPHPSGILGYYQFATHAWLAEA